MLHFIYNPVSGGGAALSCFERIKPALDRRGIEYQAHETHAYRDGVRFARELSERGAEDIIAMGGDGTLNEVLNGIVDPARVRLGLIPCGSGNDFAAVAGIPTEPEAALAIILEGAAKPTDFMVCSGVRGINAVGTGIDVDILRRYARMKLLKGSAAYLASLILTLFTYKPYEFEEIIDGVSHSHRAFIACAGNGQSIGGGIPICPRAEIDDGLLDVVIVDNICKLGIPFSLIKLLKRRVLELKTTCFKRQARLRIRSNAAMPIQIDGEIYEDLPFDLELVHGVLRMYRP